MIRNLSFVTAIVVGAQLLQGASLTDRQPWELTPYDRTGSGSLTHLFSAQLHPGFMPPAVGEESSPVELPLLFADLDGGGSGGDDLAWEDPGLGESVDSAQVDTATHRPVRRLLPDNMSVMERWVWGENGAVRNLGIASPLTPEVRKSELEVRRTMLTAHQIGGFATLGLMLATAYYGQRALDTGLRSDRNAHQTLVAFTIGAYTATAFLSIFSPPPLIRRDETSTTTIHKTLAWIHFAGMIVTPILGTVINRRGSSYYDRARVHQVAAYITTAVFAASMIVITF